MKSKTFIILSLSLTWVVAGALASTKDPVIRSYLNFNQDLYNNNKAFVRGVETKNKQQFTSHSTASMHVKNPHFQRTMKMDMWAKGTTKSLVRITAPAKDRGTSTLKVGQNLWNYLPKTSRVIKIPATLMSQGWMGSDFTNNDIVRYVRYVDEYTCTMKTQGSEVVINCIPDADSVLVWGKVIFYANKKTGIPTHTDYYDQSNNLARTIITLKIENLGGKMLPSVLEIIPKSKEKKGHVTRLTYHSIRFGVPLRNSFFSIQNLQRGLR